MIALIGVFAAGLMIGRTPEFLGKQITIPEMKLVALYTIVAPLVILPLTALAVVTDWGLGTLYRPGAAFATISNPGAHGFTQVLYAYVSAFANNGQNFAGLGANTPFYNVTLALAMIAGRFGLAIPALALAGRFAQQQRRPPGHGTLPTETPLFGAILIGTILLVGALSYFPVLAMGPIVEHLLLIPGP
jgi:K+-transporting ATPase ATPase A chain